MNKNYIVEIFLRFLIFDKIWEKIHQDFTRFDFFVIILRKCAGGDGRGGQNCAARARIPLFSVFLGP